MIMPTKRWALSMLFFLSNSICSLIISIDMLGSTCCCYVNGGVSVSNELLLLLLLLCQEAENINVAAIAVVFAFATMRSGYYSSEQTVVYTVAVVVVVVVIAQSPDQDQVMKLTMSLCKYITASAIEHCFPSYTLVPCL